MSVYPQSMYGQTPYGVSGYPARPPAVFQHQYYQPPQPPQQPPPPTYHVDPTSFRRDFTSRLSNLTFNSRIHIQDLSLMAQDHPQFASIVVQCIDQHLRQVPSWMKLPGFYLLDAIAKNVYDPYAAVFSRVVVSLFVDTYFQVDSSTRGKMEEMLLTWRTAGPSHTEIFGSDNQTQLQTAVWGDQSMASKGQVLAELQFTLGQMERAMQANPHDRTPQTHILVLNQLRRLVERGVSQTELRQILDQLRSLAKSVLPPSITRPPPRSLAPQHYAPQPPLSTQPVSRAHQTLPIPGDPIPTTSQNIPAVPLAAPSVIPTNLENLFASLVNAGLLTSSNPQIVPTPAIASIKESTPVVEDDSNLRENAIREYRTAVLLEPVKLTTSDLVKANPRVVDYLYFSQGSQCKQCGVRFAETKLGRQKMDDHLDMHFRQNSKVDQGRGHSRSWYIGLEDWIHDSSHGKGKGRADDSGSIDAKTSDIEREAKLQAQYVVVPPGAEAQLISCPICKEALKSEFLEDDEEWVWRNAVKKDDKIFHATCHAEALASTSNLAARLRLEKAHGSRSATPEVHLMTGIQSTLRLTPPSAQLRKSRSQSPPQASPESKVVGIKRKVENTDSNLTREANGTPPYKRVALPMLSIQSS